MRGGASHSLAGKYAAELRWLQSQCETDAQFEFDVLGYTAIMSQSSCDENVQIPTALAADGPRGLQFSDDAADVYNESLPTFPGMLLEDNFTAMDRIISLDDMMFSVQGYNTNENSWDRAT